MFVPASLCKCSGTCMLDSGFSAHSRVVPLPPAMDASSESPPGSSAPNAGDGSGRGRGERSEGASSKDSSGNRPRPETRQTNLGMLTWASAMGNPGNYGEVSAQRQESTIEQLLAGGRKLQGAGGSDDIGTLAGAWKLGTFMGVFLPCVCTIFGVVVYLRMGFLVGQAGIMGALILLAAAFLIAFLTTLSLAALVSSGPVSSGGLYDGVRKSLGKELGAVIGL